MTKFNSTYRMPNSKPRPWEIHPIWRGIGCLFMLLIPLLSYAGGLTLSRKNFAEGWVDLPREMYISFVVPVLGRLFLADLAAMLLAALVGFAILTILYALLANLIGPGRYGPLDAPPEHRR